MAERLKTQGCPKTAVHAGHEWQAVVRNKRHAAENRWCPGRVECDRCGRRVFTSTATQVAGGVWTCVGRCR